MLRLAAFDRPEKAWMTLSGGGDDERTEWPEMDWSLVDYPRSAAGRLMPFKSCCK
jgi:hypothetical protein